MQFIHLEAHAAPQAEHFEMARAIIRSATRNALADHSTSQSALHALAEACRLHAAIAFTCKPNKPAHGRGTATVHLYASYEDAEIVRMHTIQLAWSVHTE